MKHFFVVAGGKIEDVFVCRTLREQTDKFVIAVDSGMEFFYRSWIKPDVIVGDFDSVGAEVFSYFRSQPDIRWKELEPVKDETDTEAAVRLALAVGAEEITLLGATASRMDHALGNIGLLGIGLEAGVPMDIRDARNRIRMTDKDLVIRREEQAGTYVSLLPCAGAVEHLTLTGFKYPLTDYCLTGFSSLGISNQIAEEEGRIAFKGGILLVIESRDAL